MFSNNIPKKFICEQNTEKCEALLCELGSTGTAFVAVPTRHLH